MSPDRLWVGVGVLLCVTGGCRADLLPGEWVVPGEVAATTYQGAAGSSFGASVAVWQGQVLVGAPGAGEVWVLPEQQRFSGGEGLGAWVWWLGGVPYGARRGYGVYRLLAGEADLIWSLPAAVSFAAGDTETGPVMVAITGVAGKVWSEGHLVATLDSGHEGLRDLRRVAVGWGRVLLLSCGDDSCDVVAWDLSTGVVEKIAETGVGGGVIERDGVAWWSDPEDGQAEGAGIVCNEDGDCLVGLPGDHLGRVLGPRYASGLFNKWEVPARARLVPFDGGSVLAVDRAVEGDSIAVDGDGELIAVGVSSYAGHDPQEGRVLVIASEDVP